MKTQNRPLSLCPLSNSEVDFEKFARKVNLGVKYMIIFELNHLYYIFEDTPCYSKKNLGFFSNKNTLDEAIKYYQNLPGFCDSPNGFIINERSIPDHLNDKCILEALVYAHSEDYVNFEYDISLGLYTDYSLAKKQLELFCKNNTYLINDSHIVVECMVCESELDTIEFWKEGFIVEEMIPGQGDGFA